MILDNHGWSLKEMLFIMAILLFFVFLVAALINNLYSGFTPDTNTTYTKVELNMKNAGRNYYSTHKNEINDLITSDLLLLEDYLTLSDLTVNNDICEA